MMGQPAVVLMLLRAGAALQPPHATEPGPMDGRVVHSATGCATDPGHRLQLKCICYVLTCTTGHCGCSGSCPCAAGHALALAVVKQADVDLLALRAGALRASPCAPARARSL